MKARKVKRAMLVYQAGIANLFEVDTPGPRRVLFQPMPRRHHSTPTERNQGIGCNLLKTLLGEISGDLFATIKADNAISKATFISSGFTPIGDFESPSTGNELSVFISVR